MPRCVYCREEKSEERFRKAEHVMPQSYGKFEKNLTLHGVVCDDCNQYFGDTLELVLGRDTYEGHARFRHGVKKDMALTRPISITKNGRERTVLLSAEEYARLKRRDRRAIAAGQLSDPQIEAIGAAKVPDQYAPLDSELKDWKP